MKLELWLSCFVLLAFKYVSSQKAPDYLGLYKKYPDADESTVCGRIRDVIPRNSGRFRKILIRNTNNQALYANDDCRQMTSRAKSKLDTLSSRVTSTWPNTGIKVRVLQAWTDQVDPNNLTSLHYEGRSVTLDLSNGDTTKLSRLAGLAIESGFDWVYYANPNYIRASVIPDVCQTSVDLVFLLDGSGSVGFGNFQTVKEFLKKVVDFFNIGEKSSRIAMATYSYSTKVNFNLKQYFTKSEMRKAVDRIGYPRGGTYTGEALDYVRTNIFTTSAGMRNDPGIPKVLVLLTDGQSNGKAVFTPANELKKRGISIFSIGVGSAVVRELNQISSDPDNQYVFLLRNFNELSKMVDKLSSVSCSEGSLISSCKNAETAVESGSFKYFRTEFSIVTGNQVSVEVRDLQGVNHLYASAKSRNPGPLDMNSVKNENDRSPRAVSVPLNGKKTIYVAVQGQKGNNTFSLSFWDNLFANSTFTKSVKENLTPRKILDLQLATTKHSLVYSITDGNEGGAFRIDPNTPKLYTTKKLDRKSIAQYNLVVVAVNTANKCHKSRTLVHINVVDDNDNTTRFTADQYQASIREDSQKGTVVKIVKAIDRDSGANGQVTYTITSGNRGNLFRIESDGRVILQGQLDYEKITSYRLGIKAQDGGNPSKSNSTTLQISVTNVNESPSIKCDGSCTLKVTEDARIDTKIGKVIGEDPDTTIRCSLRYDIPSSLKNTFTVNPEGEIRTKAALDREVTPYYTFPVTVQDCGSPPLAARVQVTVNIQDVNDNDPKFNGPYSTSFRESKKNGSRVLQVKAVDKDEGINGQVRYSLEGSESSPFEIDAVTGEITTKVKLDYETKTKYIFNVIATDQGPGNRKGSTRVTVNILDVNDNKPEFKNAPYTATVAEDASRGTSVKTIEATDKDSGLASQVRYFIISGNHGNAFALDSSSGRITVNNKLDRETRSSYKLDVQASDRGSSSQSTRTTVTITITDVNDNSPVFQGLPYEKSVSENLDVDDMIVKVSATDDDDGSFGQVSYGIGSPVIAKETFKVDASGNILLKKKLDYEITKSYNFKVVATDGGGRSTEADVKVLVEDYNDNKPVFNKNPYKASVAENANIGDAVKTVTATDEDTGPRGRVTYSITGGNFGNAFSISGSGTVNVASRLDRETRETYNLTIKASDDGSPSLSTTTAINIDVSDINDNKPTFGQASYSFKIAENNALNAPVGRLDPATDRDKGVNGEIVYSIVSGNTVGAFEFKDTGELVAKIVLDRETISSYSLVIEARDKGIPSLYTRVPVQVTVQDENDNTPEFIEKA